MSLNVYSEISKLKTVLLHRPGEELNNLSPSILARLLFDDIPDLPLAQKEHDQFAEVLRKSGVEVVYLGDLMKDVLSDSKVKAKFLDDYISEAQLESEHQADAVRNYLESLGNDALFGKLVAGIRREEIPSTGKQSLFSMIGNENPLIIDPMPNLYFTRDPFAITGRGVSLNHMRTVTRNRETLFGKYIFEHHPRFKQSQVPFWYDRSYNAALEGGDILTLSDKIVAIGVSQRTDADSIEIFAKRLFSSDEPFEKIIAFDIPKTRAFMHLDTVFTMIDKDAFTIHPGIEGPLTIYTLEKTSDDGEFVIHKEQDPIETILARHLGIDKVDLIRCGGDSIIDAEREQWNDGSNTLAIAPGEVIVYDRNYVTNGLLRERGFKLHEIGSSELSRGRGGPRCMSMPLFREA
ncbi:MAG: arginine deiminase [Bacillota bacterium]|nr:arginine deiminase [Bacillota bacterium]